MYGFVDLNKGSTSTPSKLSVAMEYNGRYLEEIIGYRTLQVIGREGLNVEYERSPGKFGHITIKHSVPTEPITVLYELKADTNDEFQHKFRLLKKILYSEHDVFFKFDDDPNVYYQGRFQKFNEISPSSNHIVGSLELMVSTPYKVGPVISSAGIVTISTFYETIPDEITATVTVAGQTVTIKTPEKELRLKDQVAIGDVIVVDFINSHVTKNGQDYTYAIEINSDFENFIIKKGQTISSPQANLQIKMRERWL